MTRPYPGLYPTSQTENSLSLSTDMLPLIILSIMVFHRVPVLVSFFSHFTLVLFLISSNSISKRCTATPMIHSYISLLSQIQNPLRAVLSNLFNPASPQSDPGSSPTNSIHIKRSLSSLRSTDEIILDYPSFKSSKTLEIVRFSIVLLPNGIASLPKSGNRRL